MTTTDLRRTEPDGHATPGRTARSSGGGSRAAVSLGVRLATRSRPGRSALVLVGSALSTGLLLTAAGAYELGVTAEPALSGDDQRLLLTIVVAVSCPIVLLLLTAARLSSASRDARAAALSRLGVSRRRLRAMAAAENGALTLAGAVAGLLLHLLVLAPGFGSITSQLSWFDGRDPRTTLTGAVAIVAAVVVVAAMAGYLPHRAARPGAAVRVATARPAWWRSVPVAAGTALLGIATARHGNSDLSPTASELGMFLVGGALAIVGLPIALPIAVRLIGDLAARATSPSLVIAGRGLQDEPATTTRLVAAVLAALAVITGALCVLQAFWDVPQVQRAVIADTTGPQFGVVLLDPSRPPLDPTVLDALSAVRGVRGVVPVPGAVVEDVPGACDDADRGGEGCDGAFVGTCAGLATLAGEVVPGCRDDEVAVLSTRAEAAYASSAWDPDAPAWLRSTYYGDPPADPTASTVELPPVTQELVLPDDADDPNRRVEYRMFVPASLATAANLRLSSISLVLDGGPTARENAIATAEELSLTYFPEDLSELRRVEGYESMVWGIGAVMLATGLAGLAIAGADGAAERRRRLASLWVIGTPTRVLQRSQLFRGLLPLLIGAPLATVVGGFVGVAYLSLGGIAGRFPWQQTGSLLAIALAVAALTSVATLTGLGKRPSPDLLRRE